MIISRWLSFDLVLLHTAIVSSHVVVRPSFMTTKTILLLLRVRAGATFLVQCN